MKSAILIPCHPPKFEWLLRFLDTYTGSVPVVIASTDGSERDWFAERLTTHRTALQLVLLSCADYAAKHFTVSFPEADRAIINLKKFVALHFAMQHFDEVLCVDADSEMLAPSDDVIARARQNYDYRFFGSFTEEPFLLRINRACLRMFLPDQKAVIRAATNDCHTYTWFFDAPFYRRDDLNAFFRLMAFNHGSIDDFLHLLTYYTFDHILYTYFLVGARGAKVIDYGLPRVPEVLQSEDLRQIASQYDARPIWAAKSVYTDQPVQMLFHMDRPDSSWAAELPS